MALSTDEVAATNNDEANVSSSDQEFPMEQEEAGEPDSSPSAMFVDEGSSLEKSISVSSEEMDEKPLENKRQQRSITRSVSFAPMVEEIEIPSRYDPSYISPRPPMDYLDALVESYRVQTASHLYPLYEEEKKYVPKTTRTRLSPNWREHRIRHLMNKLEELSLWDREEELKVSQAQFLREQKLEQIHDRQRNHDLCLNLMRQRHESEMESAVLLDRAATSVNDEVTNATIARAINLASPTSATLPYTLKRRVRQHEEKIPIYQTAAGRYRQFEATMNHKLEKINEKSPTDWRIVRGYSSYRTPIPPTVVPLFSETYTALLALPDAYSSNRHKQSYYRSSPIHAASPDYETRLRSHSNRDVRVPLKEETTDDEDSHYDTDDDYRSNSLRRSTNLTSNLTSSSPFTSGTRDFSFIHSPQPTSNSVHQRSLNDDLNAITKFAVENSKAILRDITDSSNVMSTTKMRSSPASTNKRVMFAKHNLNDEENWNSNRSSRMSYQRDLSPF